MTVKGKAEGGSRLPYRINQALYTLHMRSLYSFLSMRDNLICSVKQLATLRVVCSLVLLLALFVTSTSAWGGKQDQVVNAMRDMASNWNGFKGLFAERAIVKFCQQGEASCQQGSFDDLFGPFEDAVKLVFVEHSVLVEGSTSAFLHHWTQYVETHDGCADSWSGYSSYEFDPKGKVERLVVHLERSKEVLSCISDATQAAEA